MSIRHIGHIKHVGAVALILGCLVWGNQALAQDLTEVLQEANAQRVDLNQQGMMVLMGWAGANIVSGGVGWGVAKDQRWRSVHQMNLGWGAINMGIALFGYFSAGAEPTTSLTLTETLRQSDQIQKVLWFNTALDVGYMAAGWALWERGLRKGSERFVGFGQSVILQGAFLFAFDLGLSLLHGARHDAMLLNLSPWLQGSGGLGAMMQWQF